MDKSNLKHYDVSVCISVHNTAKYLPRCLDSVCSQTLKNIEIVLVNNGSTDNSESIMYEYSRRFSNRKFVIVSQEDRSLAGGRQTGISHASGEYIAFLDADDFVEINTYEELYKCAKRENVDIVEMESRHGEEIISSPFKGKLSARVVLQDLFVQGHSVSMLWLRLYHSKLFSKVVMPRLYTNNEDRFAYPCLLFEANSVFFLKKILHTYSVDNEGGVMFRLKNDPSYVHKYYESHVTILKSILHLKEFFGDENDIEFKKNFYHYSSNLVLQFLINPFFEVEYNRRLTDASNALKLRKVKDIEMYVRCGIKPITPFFFLIKVLGLRKSCWLFKKLHK